MREHNDLHPHGGARPGAGRPRIRHKHDPSHAKRPVHKAQIPSHITLRMVGDVGRLRKWKLYRAAKRAALLAGETDVFRIVHMSIQGNHVHMIVEAADEKVLATGVQRFEILLAKSINRVLARKGKVIEFRYHRVDISTPRQMRNALSYVLNNWRRHREDVTTPGAENALIDPYSTAWAFDGWADLDELPSWDRLPSAEPTTWLLRVGWRKHGSISVREVPGAPANRGIARRAGRATSRRSTLRTT
jgi:REP element-mobilizing transposase RayT